MPHISNGTPSPQTNQMSETGTQATPLSQSTTSDAAGLDGVSAAAPDTTSHAHVQNAQTNPSANQADPSAVQTLAVANQSPAQIFGSNAAASNQAPAPDNTDALTPDMEASDIASSPDMLRNHRERIAVETEISAADIASYSQQLDGFNARQAGLVQHDDAPTPDMEASDIASSPDMLRNHRERIAMETEMSAADIASHSQQLDGYQARQVERVQHQGSADDPLDVNQMHFVKQKEAGNSEGAHYTLNGAPVLVKGCLPGQEGVDKAHSEVAASKLYDAADVEVPEMMVVNNLQSDFNSSRYQWYRNDVGVVSVWKDGLAPFDIEDETHLKAAQRDFGMHALLANWDCIGPDNDNILYNPESGKMVMVDPGGSLDQRGFQGRKNELFGTTVNEITTMRGLDPDVDADQSAAVFGSMTELEVIESLERAEAAALDGDELKDSMKDAIRSTYPDNSDEADRLIDILEARALNLREQRQEMEAAIRPPSEGVEVLDEMSLADIASNSDQVGLMQDRKAAEVDTTMNWVDPDETPLSEGVRELDEMSPADIASDAGQIGLMTERQAAEDKAAQASDDVNPMSNDQFDDDDDASMEPKTPYQFFERIADILGGEREDRAQAFKIVESIVGDGNMRGDDPLDEDVLASLQAAVKEQEDILIKREREIAARSDAILDTPMGKAWTASKLEHFKGYNPDEMAKVILKEPKAVAAMEQYGVSLEEAVAIRGYTSGMYPDINGQLRAGEMTDEVRLLMENLTSGLDKLPPYDGSTVYREMSDLPEEAQHIDQSLMPDQTYSVTAVCSTTELEDGVQGFGDEGGYFFTIDVKDENSAARDVSMFSDNDGESEVIYPPGTSFAVESREVDPDTNLKQIRMSEL